MTTLQQQIKQLFPGDNCTLDYEMAQKSFFKIGGDAEVFLEISSLGDLQKIVAFCAENTVKHMVLGGASNVVISDDGFKGVIIHLTNDDFSIISEDTAGKRVRAGAGIKMATLVRNAVDAGLEGLEYFLGVPGTLGGAIYNNAHYLSDLIGEYVVSVQAVTPTGDVIELSHDACAFGYDASRFQKSKEIIFSVTFELQHGTKERSEELIKKATVYRATTQPLGIPSSGCIFQNVPNTDALREQFPQFADKEHISGGFLIDQAGLKGVKIGDIEVSSKHAAFFVNHGNGTANDVQKLVSKVKTSVKEKFGVQLHEEVVYIQ